MGFITWLGWSGNHNPPFEPFADSFALSAKIEIEYLDQMQSSSPIRRKCLLELAAFVFWITAILWLSLTPRPPHFGLPEFFSWDKLQHAGGYALLTILAGRFFGQWWPGSRFPWLFALIFTIFYGGLIEVLQGTLTDVRRAQWMDLVADAIGGGVVVVSALAIEKLRRRKQDRMK